MSITQGVVGKRPFCLFYYLALPAIGIDAKVLASLPLFFNKPSFLLQARFVGDPVTVHQHLLETVRIRHSQPMTSFLESFMV